MDLSSFRTCSDEDIIYESIDDLRIYVSKDSKRFIIPRGDI